MNHSHYKMKIKLKRPCSEQKQSGLMSVDVALLLQMIVSLSLCELGESDDVSDALNTYLVFTYRYFLFDLHLYYYTHVKIQHNFIYFL